MWLLLNLFCEDCLLLDPGDILGQLLLALDVALSGDHDALCLRGASTVHGLGPVSDGGGTQAEVLQ